jgi:amidase
MTDRKHKESKDAKTGMTRRALLQLGALAAVGPTLGPLAGSVSSAFANEPGKGKPKREDLIEATIANLQDLMQSGRLTARELVDFYLDRIEDLSQHEDGPHLRAVIEVSAFARETAELLDLERAQGNVRGPLHGIPIILKDNIDTVDMMTTAGSLALVGPHPAQDATVTERLRQAGMIILAKANLSEWANFRGFRSVSGWSGRGRQGLNPYVLDRSPCTSSSGSAAGVSANLSAASLGTETNGSIVCPSSVCGAVGLKPTVGLTSRAGVIPIAMSQDTVGPICRTVADAATVLGAMTGVDPRDPATSDSAGHFFTDYTQFLDPDGLRGARIGIARQFFGASEHIDRIAEPAIQVLKGQGAIVIDPANFQNLAAINSAPSIVVLEYEFKDGVNKYLATRSGLSVHTLQDLIDFNKAHADEEMPYFLQQLFEESQARGPLTDQVYLDALATDRRVSQIEGIDELMDRLRLDALFAPTRNPAWTIDLINGDRSMGASSTPAALAGYPLITVTAGNAFGTLPVGVTFMGRRFSEPTLIKLAFAFEQATKARKRPEFLPTLNLP